DLDLGTGVLAEQDLVTYLDVHRAHLAVLHDLAGADSDDFAANGFLGSGIRDDDSAGGGAFFLHTTDYGPVVKGLDLHNYSLQFVKYLFYRQFCYTPWIGTLTRGVPSSIGARKQDSRGERKEAGVSGWGGAKHFMSTEHTEG